MTNVNDQTFYVLNLLRTDILTEAEDADFVRDEYAKGLRFAAKLIEDEIANETEWQRISNMTNEEVRSELRAEGYTDDMMEQMHKRMKEMIERAAKGPNA